MTAWPSSLQSGRDAACLITTPTRVKTSVGTLLSPRSEKTYGRRRQQSSTRQAPFDCGWTRSSSTTTAATLALKCAATTHRSERALFIFSSFKRFKYDEGETLLEHISCFIPPSVPRWCGPAAPRSVVASICAAMVSKKLHFLISRDISSCATMPQRKWNSYTIHVSTHLSVCPLQDTEQRNVVKVLVSELSLVVEIKQLYIG